MSDVTVAGDIGDNRMYHRAREVAGPASAGAQKLAQLHGLLNRPWFRDRHTVSFELTAAGKGSTALLILRPGNQLIATWTTHGETLMFSGPRGAELRAEILDCAVSITCEFLDQTRARRN
jgi:hypothetical protein